MIAKLIKSKTPFLLVRHRLCLFDMVSEKYDIVTANLKQEFKFFPIDKEVFYNAIETFGIPLLFEADRFNKIYGDERFKEKYIEYQKKQLASKSPRQLQKQFYYQRRVAKKNRH